MTGGQLIDPLTAQKKREWVTRILEVDLSGTPNHRGGHSSLKQPQEPDMMAFWRDARRRVDRDIEALRRAFLATKHPLAQAACEKGLGAISGNRLVRFQVALIEYLNATANDKKKWREGLIKTGQEFRQAIESSELLSILERNPYGVRVNIRPILQRTTSEILAQLHR